MEFLLHSQHLKAREHTGSVSAESRAILLFLAPKLPEQAALDWRLANSVTPILAFSVMVMKVGAGGQHHSTVAI